MPHGHWKTLTLIAALRINGMTAPYVIDGAMDGPSFLAYVEQVLAPTLRKNDIVFMDNLRTHKIDGVRQAIEAVGASVRYLRPTRQTSTDRAWQSRTEDGTAQGAARTVRRLEADRKASQDVCARSCINPRLVMRLLPMRDPDRSWRSIKGQWKKDAESVGEDFSTFSTGSSGGL